MMGWREEERREKGRDEEREDEAMEGRRRERVGTEG